MKATIEIKLFRETKGKQVLYFCKLVPASVKEKLLNKLYGDTPEEAINLYIKDNTSAWEGNVGSIRILGLKPNNPAILELNKDTVLDDVDIEYPFILSSLQIRNPKFLFVE